MLINKLKSNKGASILLAFGLLMICTMISSVVIVAAASGSSRNIDRVKRQKAYLAVSSAAQLIVDEFQEIEQYVGREEDLDYVCNDYTEIKTVEYNNANGTMVEREGRVIPDEYFALVNSEGAKDVLIFEGVDRDKDSLEPRTKKTYPEDYNPENPNPNIVQATDLQGVLANVILESCKAIYENRADSFEKEFTVHVKEAGGGIDNRLPQVKCTFKMDKNFNIEIQVQLADSTEYDYSLTIKADSLRQTDVKTVLEGEEALVCYHDVCYNKSDANGFVYAEVENMEMIGRKTIYSLTVKWADPKLAKGVTEP